MAEAAFLHAPLTPALGRVLASAFDFSLTRGYSPTVRELADELNYASLSSVHDLLVRLREMGLVTWVDGSARTLVVTKLGREAL